jgi:hypothetical protein
MGTLHRKIDDTVNIGHKTQKDRNGYHWAQDKRKIHTGNIGHKTQKDRHG